MIQKPSAPSRSLRWRSIFRCLFIGALLVSFNAMAPTMDAPPKTQPILLQIAANRPDETVGVIVQKRAKDADVEALVARLGGRVTKDLYFINAFAAELPAKAVSELARSAGVRRVSLDAPVAQTGKGGKKPKKPKKAKNPKNPQESLAPSNYYLDTLRVREVWDMGVQGQGITVAVIDSGIAADQDFCSAPGETGGSRLLKQVKFNPSAASVEDSNGHGTHLAGIIAGNGSDSGGVYAGIAPRANIIGLRISDDTGMACESDAVAAMQWVLDNRDAYNIRVVNLSINSVVEASYDTSPLDLAAEMLWLKGIVVVASAGNKGPAGGHNTLNSAPANDPLIITVGSSDEHGTESTGEDGIAPFSAHGTSMDGFHKPDIIAPGKDIISVLASSSSWDDEYPDRVVLDGEYFRLSGTSAAAPMVAGAVALLLQDEPGLTPDQVKYRLLNASGTIGDEGGTYPYLDVYAAVTASTTEPANLGVRPHIVLCKAALIAYWASDNEGGSIDRDSVNWDSVNWDSVNWDSVNWDSVNWDSVSWDSVNWDSVNWDSVNWDSVNWDSVNWDSVNWDSVNWDSVNWDSVNWDSVSWAPVSLSSLNSD